MSTAVSRGPISFPEAESQFARWRRSSRRGKPMPEELWSLAVALAGEHGVSKTARSLRLGYYALKERVAAATTAGTGSVSERRPAFVEMALGPLMPETPACVMELADARGVKLRVELPQRSSEEIASVVRALWEAAQ